MYGVFGQELPPLPSEPKPIKIPTLKEGKLNNGLRIVVIEKRDVPLVSLCLSVRSGAFLERPEKAGLARMTAELLTKGTKKKKAEQIAEEIEFLGGSLSSWADWNGSYVLLEISSDKLQRAVSVFADVVLNPSFRQKEIEILRSQFLDSLSYSLKQPSFLASYVASTFAFGEHPTDGTPESLKSITRKDIVSFYKSNFSPRNSVLIVSGDISYRRALKIARDFLGGWKVKVSAKEPEKETFSTRVGKQKFLVVNLSESGQAAVFYTKKVDVGRKENLKFIQAQVANSILGGGYSARLNQEIRIKRGLSYGASSLFIWRADSANFVARAQTKNESAAKVAELILAEIERLLKEDISNEEMKPRKAALVGNLVRKLETNQGLAQAFAEIYVLGGNPEEIKGLVQSVESVTSGQVKDFTLNHLREGYFVIVGDYAKIKDDLEKRFPHSQVIVARADELSLTKLLSLGN